MKRVRDILPQEELLAQLGEEAAELTQASLKMRRVLDGTNPTPKSFTQAKADLNEDLADVLFCIHELRDLIDTDILWETVFRKHPRWLSRLEGKA